MNMRSKNYFTLKWRKATEIILIKRSLQTDIVVLPPIKWTIRAQEIFHNKIKQQGRLLFTKTRILAHLTTLEKINYKIMLNNN